MATICFVCEGAYPYVVGGVSAWVHELITSNPQHDFKILCIIPDEKFAKLKYQIPKNVVEIKNILMDSSLNFSYSSFIKAGLQKNEEKKDSIKELIRFQVDGNADEKVNIIERLFSKEMGSPLEIILSQEYWDVLLKQYKNNIHFSAIGKPYITLKIEKNKIEEIKKFILNFDEMEKNDNNK